MELPLQLKQHHQVRRPLTRNILTLLLALQHSSLMFHPLRALLRNHNQLLALPQADPRLLLFQLRPLDSSKSQTEASEEEAGQAFTEESKSKG